MKAYLVKATKLDGTVVHTFVVAKADIPKAKAKLDVLYDAPKCTATFAEVEVPTTKRELIDYINNLLVAIHSEQ